ncbi:M15 family metallopeptidase, partial [bacterium]|nr:M15 family metallopeptidase [bacterium]
MNLSDNEKRLYGLDTQRLIQMGPHALHRDTLPAFQLLQSRARESGYSLAIVSAYRSYEHQLKIWNAKASGERAVLDASGEPIDIMSLTDEQRVPALMKWSALPGASRHHWGTDIDIYDEAAVPDDYDVQLLPSEGV